MASDRSLGARYLSSLVSAPHLLKRFRTLNPRTPEADSAQPCGSDALRLSLPDVFTFDLGHVAEQLEQYVRDELARYSPSRLTRIQKGHVQNDDVYAALLRETTPLLYDVIVASTKPVDAFHDQRIPRSHPPHETLIS